MNPVCFASLARRHTQHPQHVPQLADEPLPTFQNVTIASASKIACPNGLSPGCSRATGSLNPAALVISTSTPSALPGRAYSERSDRPQNCRRDLALVTVCFTVGGGTMNWTNGDYLVSDEKDRLKVADVENLIKQGEWCADYSRQKIARLLEKSFWLGVYKEATLVGLARMVTDEETVTMITDVIVDKAHRGRGVGSLLMECLIAHKDLSKTSMSLGTQDADRFFEKFGFERMGSLMHRLLRPQRLPTSQEAPSRRVSAKE